MQDLVHAGQLEHRRDLSAGVCDAEVTSGQPGCLQPPDHEVRAGQVHDYAGSYPASRARIP